MAVKPSPAILSRSSRTGEVALRVLRSHRHADPHENQQPESAAKNESTQLLHRYSSVEWLTPRKSTTTPTALLTSQRTAPKTLVFR